MGMDPPGLEYQSFAVCRRGHGLGHFDRMQPLDGRYCATSAPDLDLSLVHSRLRNVCLGCLDSAEFWHAGQLPAAGHHRHSGIGQDVDRLITFSWLRVFLLRVFLP